MLALLRLGLVLFAGIPIHMSTTTNLHADIYYHLFPNIQRFIFVRAMLYNHTYIYILCLYKPGAILCASSHSQDVDGWAELVVYSTTLVYIPDRVNILVGLNSVTITGVFVQFSSHLSSDIVTRISTTSLG